VTIRTWLTALGALSIVGATQSVWAADGAVDPAAAEALFKEARTLSDAGKQEEACDKYGASYKLDPAPGTLLNLASCSEQIGKTATAWSQYVETARVFRRRGDERRAAFADGEAAKLEPSLAYVLIHAPELVPGETLRRDGVDLSSGTLESKLPIDPGPHEIVASAPGHVDASVKFTAVAQQTTQVAVPQLAVAPSRSTGDVADPTRGDTQRLASYITGGVGAASLIVGVVFVGLTADAKSSLDDLCPGGVCQTTDAKDSLSQANTFANVANGMLIGGAVVVGVAVVLFFTAPSSEEPDLALVPFVPRPVCDGGACGVGWRF